MRMNQYQHILMAADLVPSEDELLVQRIQAIMEASNAKVTVLHAIEQIYNYGSPWLIENNVEWQGELERIAQSKLKGIGDTLGVPKERLLVRCGQPKGIILAVAEEIQADLIIVGSHGKHGLGLLLFGSTTNSVLQDSKCDVLAVHVGSRTQPEEVAVPTEIPQLSPA
jgi:universal stress protein A